MVFTKFCSVNPAFFFYFYFLSLAVGNCCCGLSISYSNHFLANRQSKTSTYNLHASAYWWVSEMVTTPCWVEMQMTLKLRSTPTVQSKPASHELMSIYRCDTTWLKKYNRVSVWSRWASYIEVGSLSPWRGQLLSSRMRWRKNACWVSNITL